MAKKSTKAAVSMVSKTQADFPHPICQSFIRISLPFATQRDFFWTGPAQSPHSNTTTDNNSTRRTRTKTTEDKVKTIEQTCFMRQLATIEQDHTQALRCGGTSTQTHMFQPATMLHVNPEPITDANTNGLKIPFKRNNVSGRHPKPG